MPEEKKSPSEKNLIHFKNFIRSLMKDASEVLAELQLLCHKTEARKKISLLDHYFDYAERLCKSNRGIGNKESDETG